MRKTGRDGVRAASIVAVALAALAATVNAQTFVVRRIMTEGDFVGIGSATSIGKVAVNNSGNWLVEVGTDYPDHNADVVIVRSGAVLLRENQALTGVSPGKLSSVDGFSLNGAGSLGSNYALRNTGSLSNDSGLFFNDVLIFQEGAVSKASGFTFPSPYVNFIDAMMNDSNQLLVIAEVDDPGIPAAQNRAVVLVDYDPGSGTYSERVLCKVGDIPPGQTRPAADFSIFQKTYALNNAGQAAYFVALSADPAVNGVFYLDSEVIAQEGSPSPDAARLYEELEFEAFHINNSGDAVFRARLSGDAASNLAIVRKPFGGAPEFFVQKGQVLPSLAPYRIEGFGTGPVYLSGTGNVVWLADTSNPNLSADMAIMYNRRVVIKEGQSVDGMPITTISDSEFGYRISPSGRFIVVRCVLSGNIDCALLVKVIGECPSDFNLDGLVNQTDSDQFNSAFASGDLSADYNNDGFVDGIDCDQFNNDFEAGC